jgi:hypothetical protein
MQVETEERSKPCPPSGLVCGPKKEAVRSTKTAKGREPVVKLSYHAGTLVKKRDRLDD